MKINIGDMMRNRAYLSPDLEAFVGEGYRYTFREANLMVNQMAHYMKSLPVYPGDRIAILCKNNYQFLIAMLAAAKIGAITVPLNWRLHPSELVYILNDCGAVLLLYDDVFSEAAEAVRTHTRLRYFIRAGGTGQDIEFNQALAGQPTDEPGLVSGDDDVAVIMYTSGTTGKPKGAMLTHNNLFFVTAGHCHTINWKYRDRFLSVAPLFHIGGLAPMITNIHCGTTCVFMPDFDPVKVWKTVVEERITHMMTVPVMLLAMLRVPGIAEMDLSSLEHIVCGGSIVPEIIFTEYKKYNIEVENVLGVTEYAGALTFWTHDMGWDKRTSVGKAVFHGEIKIVDPETRRELPPGQIGEIAVAGPQLFKGYWNNPEATQKVVADGWYFTGDLGMKDEDGFIYVVDRLKDMIISGGENIYPAEIEAVISRLPGVVEVGVVGKPDEKWGEVPVAFVVKAPGAELTEADIIKACTDNLARFKCVKEVIFTGPLPRNGVGKLLKDQLRQRLSG